MKTMTTEEQLKEVTAQRDELARCVIFAVNFADFKGGCVMRKDDKGGMKMESWLVWFRRELKAVGVVWDDDLLEYSRASIKSRKLMLKERTGLQAKLDAAP